jgi:putative membrane protein
MKIRYLVIALLSLPVAAIAANNPDASFYKKAAEGGISEVELGHLAQKKSSNPDVKQFGAMMIKDHSAANDKLKSIAESKDVKLPSGVGVDGTATKAKLDVLSGKTFDESYIKGMVKDHEEDIKEFEREAKQGKDPDAKSFAAEALPTLREHLKKARDIATANNVSVD